MDILKAEISRKRKQIESAQIVKDDKKYFRRADLQAKQQEDYWRRHGYLDDKEELDSSHSANDDIKSSSSTANDDAHTTSTQKMLPRKEVIKRFRQRYEPVRLFGESDYEAYNRLCQLEIAEPEITDKGMRNEFQEAMGKLEKEFIQELTKYKGDAEGGKKLNQFDVQTKEDDTTYQDIIKLANEQLGKGDPSHDQEVILKFLRFLQKVWGHSLNARDEVSKASARGRKMSAEYRQTGDYIRPLTSMLRKKNTPNDILESLVAIVDHMLAKDYILANNSYMEMSIGNAAWPVGVTNPGIHARPGREKIFAKQVAHVLNDETQRKYIHALKRLMTQCQVIFPSNPSRSVNYSFERM